MKYFYRKNLFIKTVFYGIISIVLTIVLACLFSSCSQKYCACHYPTVTHDSIINIVSVDTFYRLVDADTSKYTVKFDSVPIKDHTDTLILIDNKKNGLLIFSKNNILHVWDIQKKDSIQGINRNQKTKQKESIKVPYPVIETKAPTWAWWVLAALIALLVKDIVTITRRLIK
jgi:hypothetical protein